MLTEAKRLATTPEGFPGLVPGQGGLESESA